MKKILVCALRRWSLDNITPVIKKATEYHWETYNYISKPLHKLNKYDLIITCEPHDKHWFKFYPQIPKGIPVLALQQCLFYSTKYEIDTEEYFDKYLIWGEQMYDFCKNNGNTLSKLVLTGCPKHDIMFHMLPEDKNYILGLEGGGPHEGLDHLKLKENTIVISHPNKNGYKLKANTLELIRYASKVIIHSTGCGIWALIMKKKCEILGNNERYLGWQEKNFIKRSVGDENSTDKVFNIIKEYLND